MSEQHVSHVRCDGCGRSCPTDEIYHCNHCDGVFCPDCWGDHRRLEAGRRLEDENYRNAAGACLYCGFNPCRCDEVNAVAEGLRDRGVKVTDGPQGANV